ncbi:sigma-70 family RNA polymerase sigma factor [Anaerococcus sp.]|uniref:sigma-70 family RNA polymerase sigma factor n=1 Tax=Anaerococcus TaxID=165779 RepID=UPI0029047058|nr:sigma-70 family RNA polymerase sigma factor [Anaerococcus sp.]MDU1828330.1 sigma-70 family RNA polymerase sigma factor [Anaerococcus sp.]MDU1864954.1 sigma-70 family RNA polymerase sigma factor [Anaerococcus sp.]
MQINIDNSEQIIDAYMPLIKANARKFSRFEYDEMIDESKMLAIEAICEYDESKGSFGNFLKLKLLYHYLDKSKIDPVNSLDDLDSNGQAIIDTLIDDFDFEEMLFNKEEYKYLYKAINNLDMKDRKIIMYKFFYDMNLAEIAKVMNISYKTVANRSSLAIKILRNFYKLS